MTRRDEIFEILCDWAKEHRGNSPSENELLKAVKAAGYSMTRSTLRTHMLKLRVERRLDRTDGELIIDGSDWIPPDPESPAIVRLG